MRWEQLSPPLYRTPAGEAACSVAYEAALAAVPYPFEARRVSTRWGAAHVMVCGRSGAQPLVVWHGMGAPSPWMVRMFDQLEPHYRIYVPDLPSHAASRSEPAVLSAYGHEHGQWAADVLAGLGLLPADADGRRGAGCDASAAAQLQALHIGVSFGGAVILDLANVAPGAIRGAALVVPGGLAPLSLLSILFRVRLPSLLYRLWPCAATARLPLAAMCDEPGQAGLEMVLLAWRHVTRWPQLPGGPWAFPASKLTALAAPTIVIAAERDCIFSGAAAVAAAQAGLADCEAVLLRGAKHVPAPAVMLDLTGRVHRFFVARGLVLQEE